MANILKNFWASFSSKDRPVKDEDVMYLVTNFDTSPQFNDFSSDVLKNKAVFETPALLKVFCLQCDLFSLGKIKVIQNDKEVTGDPVAELLNNPNPMQSAEQLMWDYMFSLMKGNAYQYVHSNIAENVDNKIYFLEPHKMEWPSSFETRKDKLVFSKNSANEFKNVTIKYKFEDSTCIDIPLSKIDWITDLSNGTGNWFKGNSRIDGLKKIISNSEAALDAININTRYTGKFMVAGQADPKDTTKPPMGDEEKKDIETKMNSAKKVFAVKSMIDIKRFVENIGALKLDESFRTAYFLIGSMYNIPKDVLEAYLQGSTFDNQEKATAKHITYTLQPKANDWLNRLERRFGYDKIGKQIIMSWDHLPFMQVFEKDRAQVRNTQIQTMTSMLKLGIDINEINDFLGTDFKKATYEQPKVNPGGN